MSRNRLAAETSPYLLQHKDNPVDWYPWGPEALAAARDSGKPLLLSVGYAACHWCHVMAHESFEDPETAAVMNEHFVSIKVDREERPDIDAIYQTALALLGQPGGWPLTMFLTPDGAPFWGGTYFPPVARYGRPGFRDVLRSIAEIHRAQPDKVDQNVTALRTALEQLSLPDEPHPLTLDFLDQAAQEIERHVDPIHGGLTGAPKFPQASLFAFLWQTYRRTGQTEFRDAVTLTLDRMAQGGIYDHIGGGFARYATDEEWLVPHFEKMLYDNALLVDLLTLVWQETKSPLYAQRVRETIDWLFREMAVEGGAFAGSLDADSEGEEGRYYVWTEAEIDALLGTQAPAFKAAYDVIPHGNWEGRTILNRRLRPAFGSEPEEARLAEARRVLAQARAARVRPGRDDKVLADWNGLTIAALARAGAVFEEPAWIARAAEAFAFIRDRMSRDGRLGHSWRAERLQWPGVLDDHAAMIHAALALFDATGEGAHLDQAVRWTENVDRHHWDEANGGYFFTADDAETLITRTKAAADTATPSGNGLMAQALSLLHRLTGRAAFAERAERTVAAFSGQAPRAFVTLPTLLAAVPMLSQGLSIVVVGERDETAAQALVRAVRDVSLPGRALLVVPPGAAFTPDHPAHGKFLLDGRPAAYVCVGPTCSLPLADPAALADTLRQA